MSKHTGPRNYSRELELQKRRGEGVGKKLRMRARRAKIRKSGAKALNGKDVGHKKPLKSGGSNGMKNLRVESVASNRSAGGKSGDRHKKGLRNI